MATDEMSGWPVTGHSEVTSSVVNRTRVQPSGAGKHSTWSTGPRAGRPSRVRSSAGEDAGTLTRVSTGATVPAMSPPPRPLTIEAFAVDGDRVVAVDAVLPLVVEADRRTGAVTGTWTWPLALEHRGRPTAHDVV